MPCKSNGSSKNTVSKVAKESKLGAKKTAKKSAVAAKKK